jgi:CDP-diacylglycerol--serine O-phosphatidyltransferase
MTLSTLRSKGDDTLVTDPKEKLNRWYSNRFKMIRAFTLADYVTFCNMGCGIYAMLLAIEFVVKGEPTLIIKAIICILLGLFFDIIDGQIARFFNTESKLGKELDSFSDAITFAIAPIIIAYCIGFNSLPDIIILIFFAACCISRLSRFNVTSDELSFGGNKVKLILGLPTAWSLLPTIMFASLLYSNNLSWLLSTYSITFNVTVFHWPILIYLLIGLFMISDGIRFQRPFID